MNVSPAKSAVERGPGRFAFIDALRGVAAMSVVVYHIYKQNLLKYAETPFPEPFHTLFVNGYLGVYIFFVLSGFVIAYSVRGYRITPGFVGRFALRRSLRLDPPYWVAMIGAILVALTAQQVAIENKLEVPSAGDVVAHVFYIQQFLGIPHILGVFWTLCLEIQFYLLYVVLLGLTQRFAGDRLWVFFGPIFVLSLIVGANVLDLGHALCLWAWPFFFVGAATSWHFDGRISSRTWGLIMAAACLVALDAPERIGVALLTAAAIFFTGRATSSTGATLLRELSLGRVLQYLGKISYSLYLTHLLIGSKSARLAIRFLGRKELGLLEMVAILLGCVAASVVLAHVMYLVVERTAVKLSKLVSLVPRGKPRVGETRAEA